MARIFVGAGWPYANAAVHMGHFAGAYLPADAFARFHRLRGNEVLFVSGSDVHGTPILVTAEAEGSVPSTVAARFDALNREAFRQLGVSFDVFTSTHTVLHERTVQELFLALLENGLVGRRTEEIAYCPRHGRFLPDRYVLGECPYCHSPTARGDECDACGRILEVRQLIGPRCRLDGGPAEFRPSEHFYLLLEKLAPRVEEYVAAHPDWRANVLGVTRNFLSAGLHATSITRDLDWGVPIPLEGYASKRFYVWFDAVIGYLSASREWAVRAGRPEAWRRYWAADEPARAYYFVGKDNIFFHTIVWPAILLGVGGLQLPADVPANEWMQIGGRKISKSAPADAKVFLPSLLARYPPDLIRFYAALLAPQNRDTEFDWDEFHQVADEVLSNQYGNLAQRILVLCRERSENRVPSPPDGWSPDAPDGIGERLRLAHREITREFEAVRLKEAFDRTLAEVREANRRFHEAKPWQASPEERSRALYEGLWTLKALAVWLSPFLPFSSDDLWRMLGYPFAPEPGTWDEAIQPPEPGQRLGEVHPLFPRREPRSDRSTSAPPERASAPAAAAGGRAPLAIRVGRVERVEPHPSADKLYLLTVDEGGSTPRSLVAGLRPYYTAEELTGRRVAVLANLAPRTIRRFTSQGMVLAADVGERAVLLAPPPTTTAGTFLVGGDAASPTVSYEEFARTPLVVGRVEGPHGPDRLRVDIGGRTVEAPGSHPPGTEVIVRLDGPEAGTGEVLAFPDGTVLPAPTGAAPGAKVR